MVFGISSGGVGIGLFGGGSGCYFQLGCDGRNRVADLLAKKGRTLRMDSTIFLDPPAGTLSLVEEEQPSHSLTIDTSTEVELVVSFDPGGIGC
ncbi:hypothetical protein V6N12_019769 [Hibiscus sabdariffa]|uniref:Uncharacterized protein n=1 Tax=Hibiscus sabdariffa TaxID=183260 RepID=A0ABR2AZN7_9ROSI